MAPKSRYLKSVNHKIVTWNTNRPRWLYFTIFFNLLFLYSPIFSLNCICCHLISRTIFSISNSMQFILNHIYYPQIFPLKIWKLSKELLNFKTKTMPFPLPNWVVNIHCRSRCAVECKQTQSGYANYPLRTVFFWKYLTLIIKSKW
jgi:hypothetical protein